MRTGTVKGGLQLFGIIAAGSGLFGLWEGYGIGEALISAVILSAFVVGIAWVGVRAERRFNRQGGYARLYRKAKTTRWPDKCGTSA